MNKDNVVSEIIRDLGSDKVFPALFTGLINGILLVIVAVSFAAMIFSGEMSGFATRAVGLTLFSACAMGVVLLLTSGLKTHVSVAQDAPAATLVAASSVVAGLLPVSSEAAFMTLVAILALTSLLTGLSFFLVGRFELANLFRFVPYPVIGGFLAGSGWFLLVGGIAVMCGVTPGISTFGSFLAPDIVLKWAPGLTFAVTLFTILQRWSHFLILPVALLGGSLAYYLAFLSCDLSLDRARELGYLVSSVPNQGLWPVFPPDSLAQIHWDMVLSQLPLAGSVVLIAILGMLLNISGVEISADEDIDLNREFRSMGMANLLTAVGGSSPGYTSLSLSLLGVRTGALTRICGLVSTLVCVFVLFVGGQVLTFFPKPVLGAFLALLGFFFLWDWIVHTYRRMPRIDYFLILIITSVIIGQGFMAGIIVGLAATLLIFVVRFSRVAIVDQPRDLCLLRSSKQRSAPELHLLQKYGAQALCYQLRGYLFFGSTCLFVEKVRSNLAPDTGILLLDFSAVSGIDISAARHFHRLLQTLAKNGVATSLVCPPQALSAALEEDLQSLQGRLVDNLETALITAENQLLAEAHRSLAENSAASRSALFDLAADDMLLQLERQEWAESLAERLTARVPCLNFDAGKAIGREKQAVGGLLLLVSGIVTEPPGGRTVPRQLTAGAVLYPQAQFTEVCFASDLWTESKVEILQLSPAKRQALETTHPELALEFDRYVLTQGAFLLTNHSDDRICDEL